MLMLLQFYIKLLISSSNQILLHTRELRENSENFIQKKREVARLRPEQRLPDSKIWKEN